MEGEQLMTNNPAKRLSEIEQLQKELKEEANEIKDFLRKLAKGHAEMFDYGWTQKVLVQAPRKAPTILVRKEVDNALTIARTKTISAQCYNKCYTKGAIPKPTVKLIDA